ncbi:MAG TPA: T3SS effector HopA1 family protein [Jatrophihabitantaceae bacterium]|jgi:hypothetical protein|nr:T3SS effector HopA1 family protein [Jatrophihabitantaceae bacterium]
MNDRWPQWAREQLQAAVTLASSVPAGRPLAVDLYERWFTGAAAPASSTRPRPLVGEYRRAHEGVATRIVDGLPVLDRHDRLGDDGWWRTWNTSWRPAAGGARVLMSAEHDCAALLVGALTSQLRDVPYLLACPTDASRLARRGSIVLYLPRLRVLTPELVGTLATLLRAETPPLCLPLAPGIAVAQYPDNGMTFGEHRCHLVALALRDGAQGAALTAIADVFAAHGVDPAAPYRTVRGLA